MEIIWEKQLHTGGQFEAYHKLRRFTVLACGTRWGKTRFCANRVIDVGLKNPKAFIWWVAPTYELTEVGKETIYQSGELELFGKENKIRRLLPLITGAMIQFKSTDNPISLLAKGGIDLLIVDEASKIPDNIWHTYLRRTLLDNVGEAVLISTPKGKNWFYQMYLKGRDPAEEDYVSFHFPTWLNPLLNKKEINEIKRTTPEMVWRQEFGAEFLEKASAVFRKIRECAIGNFQKPKKGENYVIGVDPAKYEDFWVNAIVDSKRNLVALYRSQKLDWEYQIKITLKQAKEYNDGLIHIDSTGVGDPIFESMRRQGAKIDPFRFTSETKRELVENFALMMEHQIMTYPPDEQLLNELESFECERLPTGNLRYSAPAGYKDDCVIALALAMWKLSPFKLTPIQVFL